uniref:Uncharacterized protein n=1 Tax=Hyaloperonospora arabidopsidis (strain Emoy2) TaxID=559515 RepID=M4BS64_HYAAE
MWRCVVHQHVAVRVDASGVRWLHKELGTLATVHSRMWVRAWLQVERRKDCHERRRRGGSSYATARFPTDDFRAATLL